MAQDLKSGPGAGSGAMGRLKAEARGLASALGDRAMSSVREKVEGTTGRLTDYVEGGAGPGLMAAVTGAKDMAEGKGPARSALGAGFKGVTEKVRGLFGKGGKGGKGKGLKVINIVESIDVGVPVSVAYNQWTQFRDFPSFMKKVENVDQVEDEKLHWKAQVFWSHREWDADIIEQVPDERIIWRSKGQKGHVDGAVTFHELEPNLTRILVVLEYHPQGMFERTGNLWRAQGRRARLELKHYRRHVMTNAILHPDEIEGWRGVIQDGEVVEEDEAGPDEQPSGDTAEARDTGDEPADEGDADDRGDGAQDGDLADEQQAPEEEGDEVSPNGQGARERSVRAAGGGRAPGRQPARRQRPGRTGREEERPERQRTARQRDGTRGS